MDPSMRKAEVRAARAAEAATLSSALPTPSMPETSDAPHCIIGMMASCIDGAVRWAHLEQCMASIWEQVSPLNALCVGVSFASSELFSRYRDPLTELVSRCQAYGVRPHLIVQKTSTTQGDMWHQMHAHMVAHTPINNAWYLFSDDDDLWAPERVAIYRQMAGGSNRYTTALRCDAQVEDAECTADTCDTSSASMVTERLEQLVRDKNPNYVMFCLRTNIFGDFLAFTDSAYLRSLAFYDVALLRFVDWYGKPDHNTGYLKHLNATKWLYYYRKVAGSNATKGAPGCRFLQHFGMTLNSIFPLLNDEFVSKGEIMHQSMLFLMQCPPAVRRLYDPEGDYENLIKLSKSKGKLPGKTRKGKKGRGRR
jgi:hypothetical protein